MIKTAPSQPFHRHAPIYGALLGATFGMTDYGIALALGIHTELGTRDVTPFVAAFLALSNAAFGYVIGRLILTRAELRHRANIIKQHVIDLERSRRRSIEIEKLAAIGRLAAGIAHEVRNPLSIIRTSAALLSPDQERDSEARRARDFICEEVDRLNAFVAALLAYAKPLQAQRRLLPCQEILDAALTRAQPEFEARQIQSERHTNPQLPIKVDATLMISALLGLLLNAAEACEIKGRVAIRAFPEGPSVIIEVADDGPGLDPKLARQAFEPFVTTRDRGTGLGLAMAARIFEAHGANAEFVSGRGLGPDRRGACLRLKLPEDDAP